MSSRAYNSVVSRIMVSPIASLSSKRYSTTSTSIIAYNTITEATMARVTWRHTGTTTKILMTMPIGVQIKKSFPIDSPLVEMKQEIADLFALMDYHWFGEYQTPPLPDKEEGE